MSSSALRPIPLFLALVFHHSSKAQYITGLGQVGGAEADVIFDLKEAPSGALFATGGFRATADFDPGAGVFSVTGIGPGGVDHAFVAKYDAAMDPLWVANLGGGFWLDHGSAVAPTLGGGCFAIGQFHGSGDFDPGPGVTTLTAVDESDVFCVKLDANGVLDWAVQFGDTAYDIPSVLAADGLGNVIIGGRFVDTLDVDPGPNVQLMYPEFGSQGLLIKLDPQGGLVWAVHMGYRPQRVIIDQDDGILLMGAIGGYMDADPGTGVVPLDAVNGANYLVRLDANGNYVSAFQFGRALSGWGIEPVDLELDPSGNMIIAGYYYGSVDVDPGPGSHILTADATTSYPDMFVAKLDPSGGFLWAFGCGAAGVEQAMDVTVTSEGPILISGSAYGSVVDLDPGTGIWNTTIFGEEDPFLLAVDPNGNFLGATSIGGSGTDVLNGTFQRASGALMGYGIFENTVDFDPGPDALPLSSVGEHDIYFAQVGFDPTSVANLFASHAELRISPNPAADHLHITGSGAGAMRINVCNAFGAELNVPVIQGGSTEVVVDVSKLPSGTFYVRGASSSPPIAYKFIIAR